jgi:tetratricopeptide (TPR) repeat protein
MLFNEWKQLFNLAHDDISKQQAIIDRKKSLEELFDKEFVKVDEEYMALFALQTAYAIIVKILAFKVLSQARYKKSLINFYKIIFLDFEALRMQMEDLENGAIFVDYGITNLLEGDFFSWYVNKEQWNKELYNSLISLFKKLSKYSDSVTTTSTKKAQDFFKELYQSMVPGAVRHALGEYYTKKWLAKKVIDEVLLKCPVKWTALDPCCGSGTFVSVLIEKVLEESDSLSDSEKARQVLSRVKGIDLNPIASLTARVNYFINIARYVESIESFEIPIYLGDSSYVPKRIKYENIDCLQYTINTIQNSINVLVPLSMVNDNQKFSFTMNKIERYIKILDSNSVFQLFCSLCSPEDLIESTKNSLCDLAEQLVELEKRKWNGIWARILTNFLTTANMGKFDLIVGNHPWVDWKSLPSGYRDRIKGLCISRKLFSGDSVSGGINLISCALITNVVAQNWSSPNGVIGFLTPEPLVFQQHFAI